MQYITKQSDDIETSESKTARHIIDKNYEQSMHTAGSEKRTL